MSGLARDPLHARQPVRLDLAARRSVRPAGGVDERLVVAVVSAAALLHSAAQLQKQTAELLQALATEQGPAPSAPRRLNQAGAPPTAVTWTGGERRTARVRPRRLRLLPANKRQAPPLAEPLTARELAVLRLLQGPLPLSGIGRELNVSQNTIKTHTRAIYRKLRVHRRRDAIQRGMELEILPPGRQIAAAGPSLWAGGVALSSPALNMRGQPVEGRPANAGKAADAEFCHAATT